MDLLIQSQEKRQCLHGVIVNILHSASFKPKKTYICYTLTNTLNNQSRTSLISSGHTVCTMAYSYQLTR